MQPLPLVTKGKEILHLYDLQDHKLIGKPLYFDLDTFIQTVEMLICSDEIQAALRLMDPSQGFLPAFYREPENYPIELKEIKETIYRNTYDQIEYGTDDEEASCSREFGEEQWLGPYTFPRAQIITEAVTDLNNRGLKPWIFDLGCSHGNLPLGLLKHGKKFNYFGKAMNYRASRKIREWIGEDVWRDAPADGQPKWLVCTEVIEHCFNPHDIVHSAHKIGVVYDKIFLSVPLGCLYGGLPNWRTRKLGHVRGWTKREFLTFAHDSFPGYRWNLVPYNSMVAIGEKL